MKHTNILLDDECLAIVACLPRSFNLSDWVRKQIKIQLKESKTGEQYDYNPTNQ